MKQLVLIHARSPQRKEPDTLRAQYLDALTLGMKRAKLALPQFDVRFIYYDDVPMARFEDITAQAQPDAATDALLVFCGEFLAEVAAKHGAIDFHMGGVANQVRVLNLLRALGECRDSIDVAPIVRAAAEAAQYLVDMAARSMLVGRVRAAIDPAMPGVVVGHGLGSLLAYDLLTDPIPALGTIPLFVTCGSPLGFSAVRKHLRAIRVPARVERWCNVRDANDAAAMFPLDPDHFPVTPMLPMILDKSDVRNNTTNHHGIEGYLGDAEVARWIYHALAG